MLKSLVALLRSPDQGLRIHTVGVIAALSNCESASLIGSAEGMAAALVDIMSGAVESIGR